MNTVKKPRRNLEFANLDRTEFEGMLQEHLVGVMQGLQEVTIAMGDVVGHTALAEALRKRVIASDTSPNSIGRTLLDAVWRAETRHAERDSRSRT